MPSLWELVCLAGSTLNLRHGFEAGFLLQKFLWHDMDHRSGELLAWHDFEKGHRPLLTWAGMNKCHGRLLTFWSGWRRPQA